MCARLGGIAQGVKSEQALPIQHRAGFVESVEAVCQLEEVIREDVWAKVVQDRGDDFGELVEAFCERELGGFAQEERCSRRPMVGAGGASVRAALCTGMGLQVRGHAV